MWNSFYELGWRFFPEDKHMFEWANHAKRWVKKKLSKGQYTDSQLRCAGTWFVGVNFLENNSIGELGDVDFYSRPIMEVMTEFGNYVSGWDQGQVSICYPGYPKKMSDESEAAFKYRKQMFGAHVDGILPMGKNRRRYFKEAHAFVLGIPLSSFNKDAAPLVVWEKSHLIVRSMIWKKLKDFEVRTWSDIDITETYHEARRLVFRVCKPKIIWAPVGSGFIVHRHTLHGIKPWASGGVSEDCGRMIAYFRPMFTKNEYWASDQI